MPQPHKLSDYTEFQPKKERRTPLPITNLPVNAISEDVDPTLEIRTLIEQLQQTARDARGQTHAAEQKRDETARELARAEQQIEALRTTERELRSHFVEITSLIEERDAAQDEAERRTLALTEATRKSENAVRERNDAQRQRDDALRQRDESMRKFESFQRGNEEQARIVTETQKQLLTIRQARDGAHAQILDLNTRLGHAEDQIAELEYQRDAAQKSNKQISAEASEFRRQVDIITTDRDATARQIEHLSEELDAQRKKYLDLVEQKSAVQQADTEHSVALAEARAQVESLSHERDAARNRAQEQTRELEELRTQFQAFRDEQAQTSDTALAEAREKVVALETQVRESRHESRNLRQQLEAMNEQLNALQLIAEQAGSKSSTTQEELDAIIRDRDAALTSLTAAQKQIDHIIRDRDQVRKLATDNAIELETRLTTLQAQFANHEETTAEAAVQRQQLAGLRQRFEDQRVETIDLATQLQSAQREIRELSATLAETKLQAKFALAANRAAKEGKTKSDFASLVPAEHAAPRIVPEEVLEIGSPDEVITAPGSLTPTAPLPEIPSAAGPEAARASTPVPAVPQEPLTERESRSALGAMRHCFQAFTKTPNDLSLLNELHCHVESFAERARVSSLLALHRLCAAFAGLTRGLYDAPEQVNPSTLRTVHQTIEFLAALMKEKNLGQVKDPATAMIYAVDDDLGNCESIALAMEESGMRTTYALEPATGLAELAGGRYDLILLDVNLPGMDGFELCKQIRGLAIHEKTPIVFLTGLATLENRVQSSLSGGNDFIAKPFNLFELSVKAITLLLKAQLQLA
jgi:CheY-like chemotaxis protein